MHFITQLTVTSALLTAFAYATPLTKRNRFTVHQTVSKSSRRHGPVALAHIYRKFGKNVPAHVADAVANINTNDSVAATPSPGDEEYDAVVTIGSDGQTFNLDFDTGSSDLWVYSTELPQSDYGNHSIYDAASSNSSKPINATWSISYGDGSSANGGVHTDIVSVGGATVQMQAIELASNVSSEFLLDFSNDGLLGLGFDSINNVQPVQQKTFFSNVKSSLASPLFTADLRHAQPGSYDFGFIDASKYIGDITYVDADPSQGYWGATATGFQIGGDDTNLNDASIAGIVDTGTTLLILPEKIVKAYYKKVDGSQNDKDAGGYTFPCDATLPDFYLSFGAYTAKMTSDILNFGKAPDSTNGSTCFGGMQAGDSDPYIFGDIFLKSTFVVFNAPDNATPSLGFAAKPGLLQALDGSIFGALEQL